jgi:hypothetical protein
VVESAGKIVSHQRRLQNGSETTNTTVAELSTPRWLKLVRKGSLLTSFQ